ncbi:MAG: thymidine kinase [Deltaproteobacteria bacterium CG2_30_63_29]|nr:MAG: thymidine kinase [Deltaproteobacteria bacterium CG2_30_63_29]PJB42428.1 MAG: thymidine kinase [Deltaproteobacteria bacterium CG_4_9_14_3_um_filter_63_12]
MSRLEVVCGPMFSGKSEELIRHVRRTLIARRPVWVFKPALDERYSTEAVVSHDGRRVEAISAATLRDVIEHLTEVHAWEASPGIIAIDELQFFAPDELDRELIDEAEGIFSRLIRCQHRVVVSGLDLDFRGKPFGVMPAIMAMAEKVSKLTAVCQMCGEPATRSQRLIDGKPAPVGTPVVLVGGDEAYEARCIEHWRYGD